MEKIIHIVGGEGIVKCHLVHPSQNPWFGQTVYHRSSESRVQNQRTWINFQPCHTVLPWTSYWTFLTFISPVTSLITCKIEEIKNK